MPGPSTPPERDPIGRDLDIITMTILALTALFLTASIELCAVPYLVDLHRTDADLGALVIAVGGLCFAFLFGRYLWRAANDFEGDC